MGQVGGWVGSWMLAQMILGGGGGSSRLLACKISQKQTNKAKTSVHNRQNLYQKKKKLKRPTWICCSVLSLARRVNGAISEQQQA